ncbi:spore germination protein [Pseudalkalibacillus caeni]|uniref:Spore germination protein n=1 Tax=Exobacillus caeni TaxID=2574798 RepID=A0A5R9EY51_9BACL|nr:spore germination protein [Pseudalkalibacillus caeni]TLS34960.1 spore germination protein [Pseudalkalibacillus caeni]
MPVINNIFNIKVNSIANNGSISFGNTYHSNHTANSKLQGANTSVGDFAPANSMASNNAFDPDVTDMAEVGNVGTQNGAAI